MTSPRPATLKPSLPQSRGNGDVNPDGVAVVTTTGSLIQGNILISNFKLQGTGTTIVQVSPSGTVSLFLQIVANSLPGPCPGGI